MKNTRAINVAIVTEYYYPSLGGISEHVHYFSRELVRLGHRVAIITSHLPGEEAVVPPPGVRLVRFGRGIPYFCNGSFARVTWGVFLSRRLREFFEREQFDVVHIHSPTIPVLPLIAQAVAKSVVVSTSHTYFESNLFYRLCRPLLLRYFQNLDGRIAVSHLVIESLHRYFPVDFRIIPNGVDVELFAAGKPLPKFSDGRVNILFLGRLDPRNGLDCLIGAFRLVRERAPRARLIVIGDGPLRRYYRLVADAELAQHIVFVGQVDAERPDYYASADIFCFPAQKASFGITMLEAMAASVPTVASNLEAFRQLVGQDGAVLVDPYDEQSLADALLSLIDQRAAARIMADRSRRVVERYSWTHVAAEVVAYYRELLDRAGP